MQTAAIIEERIIFNSGGLRLAGVINYPQSENPVRAILLCSPHPHFAGNMDNNIIAELAKYLARDSVALQFDYRGVGDSQIDLPDGLSVFDYWDNIEESKNYNDAIHDVQSAGDELSRIAGNLPLIIIGYSFGAATAFISGRKNNAVKQMIGIAPPLTKINFDFMTGCAKPVLVIFGEEDFLYSPDELERFGNITCPSAEIELLDGHDHFLRGGEKIVAEKVYSFICNNI